MQDGAKNRDADGWISAILPLGGAVATAAVLGSLFTPNHGKTKRWYDSIEKAPFNPPNAVFGPVWGLLYVLIVASGVRVWRSDAGDDRSAALRWWYGQMTLNAIWSPLFFGLKRPGLALADQLLLLPALVAYIRRAKRVDALAGWLFSPYVAWVAFATLLNAEVVRRNASKSI